MQTPEKLVVEYFRMIWWEKTIGNLAVGFVMAGVVIAIWQFYDEPGLLAVPFILTGIACFLYRLYIYADCILVDLNILQNIVKEGQERGE